ncbi:MULTISPECIES: DUF4232 domain-containing protein [Streptomyces]|uniref:DUF4232 domain-containing protein n=1 Tax=Streptomyces TaxID=1883 RepID=UPI0002EFC06C|nr:DUF4232 domain-containing protein [Streptomyces venezuelae]APE25648.1 hypothetical protein vnz_34585 [Streptomyces venezuelae]QES02985.1 DUF4232 domain-containing protein [Streptomyces venezuelae ATCC 10712]
MRPTRHNRPTRHTVPAAVAVGLLLLTGCGTEQLGAGGAATSAPPVCGPGAPSAGSSAAPSSTTASEAAPQASASPAKDGVAILGTAGGAGGGARPCAAYSVTSQETVPFTYVVTFSFLSDSGQALGNVTETVPAVAPGRTVRGTVTASDLPGDAAGGSPRVRVVKVRGVPTAEAPVVGGTCPPSGVRVYADEGDAAMGLRVVGLHLENCGTRPYPLDGYPRVELRDEDRDRVSGVSILQGGAAVATGTGADGPPRSIVLKPGERAYATLVWRNTVASVTNEPVNAPYARVWAKPGAAPVMVTPEFDLGTTGKLGVGPWKKDEAR